MEVVPMQRFPPTFMQDEVGTAELQVLLLHDHGVALQVAASFALTHFYHNVASVPSS